MPQESSTCPLDEQWRHWANQGAIVEPVWSDNLLNIASSWCNWLRNSSLHVNCEPAITYEETEECRVNVRPGKAAGPDGVPSDVIRNLPALSTLMHLLFSLMFRFGVYPLCWGSAIIRAILKPGKPKHLASSLRGIRLLSSFAGWFGRVFDKRMRRVWKPGHEQFGFRSDTGCSEAVALLIALILSRTLVKTRLFVLWVDLRTAFPSLSRPILLHKMFHCGLGLGLCRMMLAILDVTSSIVCIGKFVSSSFKETLGVREGSVESPHCFNMYVDGLRSRLESAHPRLCRLMGVIVAILLYADDAALPADSAEDLQLLATLFEEFCNEHRLFIATPKTFVTVFHSSTDHGVTYQDDAVVVDGQRVRIRIYGKEISAAQSFKYLGVVLDSTCNQAAHSAS